MSDLFSGKRSQTSWIQPTVNALLLQQIGRSTAAAADGDQKPKLVQVVRQNFGDDCLLISDGAHSIVAADLSENYTRHHPQRRLKKGCIVRINNWEIVVERNPSETWTHPRGRLFEQNAIPKEGNHHVFCVYLKVTGSVVLLGSKDVVKQPTPLLEDTDIRRAIKAIMGRKNNRSAAAPDSLPNEEQQQQQQQPPSRDLPIGSVADLFGLDGPTSENNDVAAIFASAAAIPPAVSNEGNNNNNNNEEEDLPVGDRSTLLGLSQPSDSGQNGVPLADGNDDRRNLPTGNLADLFGDEGDSVMAAVLVAAAAPPGSTRALPRDQANALMQASDTVSSTPPPKPLAENTDNDQHVQGSSSEDEEEQDLGIGNMLVDPTQNETPGLSHHITSSPSPRRSAKETSWESDGATNRKTVVEGSVDHTGDLETPQVARAAGGDKAAAKHDIGYRSSEESSEDENEDGVLATQRWDSVVVVKDKEPRISGMTKQNAKSSKKSKSRKDELGGIDPEIHQQPNGATQAGGGRTAIPYSERREEVAKRKDHNTTHVFVSTAERWLRIVNDQSNKKKPPTKRLKGPCTGGDLMRAYLKK